MRFIVLPSPQVTASTRSTRDDLSLGGAFYDYLCRHDGSIAGVRYYLMDEVVLDEHPVYRQFLADRRFSFRPGAYVDIVFGDGDADALQQGRLEHLVTQDFCGESVFEYGGRFGIAFDLPDEALIELGCMPPGPGETQTR